MRLLVTRPAHPGARTAEKLKTRGHQVLLAPLLRTEPVTDIDIGEGEFEALVFTSANAVAAIVDHPRAGELTALQVFVVGRRTAEAVRAAGFANVTSAGGNQDDLVRTIRERFSAAPSNRIRPLLYLAGADRAGDIAGDLARAGITVRTLVVYRAVAADSFAAEPREALALGRLDGVLHYSRRSAQAFIACARDATLLEAAWKLDHFCLSEQVAEPLLAAGARTVLVASRPEESALFELIDQG